MTREEALESGIRQAWRCVGDDGGPPCESPNKAAQTAVDSCDRHNCASPDELEGFAVGLQLVAVEVAEIARKRREAEMVSLPALDVIHDDGEEPEAE
jgi:hypothetical protein